MLAFFRSLLASIIGFFISILFIFFLLLAIAAGSKKHVSVKDNSVLTLKLNGEIPERPSDNPLKNLPLISEDVDIPLSLKEILDDIKYAKDDPKIKGIYMELGIFQAGLPTLEEIRNALIAFRKSGKFVYTYSEVYTNKAYYLSTASDSIFINPNGVISFSGFHSEQMFMKGLLEKLDVKPILVRGRDNKYKSAGEMFINDSMSAASREQLSAFMNSAYDDFLAKISEARHVSVEELRKIADNMLAKFPFEAVKYKLIDKACYKDQVINSLLAKTGAKNPDNLQLMSMGEYNEADHHSASNWRNSIAVIYAVGEIGGGDGAEDKIGSEKLSRAIREAREDDNIKAIVLRVNSPGGGALASDVIWREVLLAKQKKPVIASFGDVAASGGYYIAAPADMIYAEPNTITGSIGVFGLLMNAKAFWKDKLGITWDRVKTGKYADIGNPNRPITQEEIGIIQTYIDTTYEAFKNRVAWGRKKDRSFVDGIAQGHIYSGIQALQLGLVDKLGNLDDAIAEAARRANLKDYSTRILPEYKSGLSRIMQSLGRSQMSVAEKEISKDYSLFKQLNSLQNMNGVMMYYPYDINVF